MAIAPAVPLVQVRSANGAEPLAALVAHRVTRQREEDEPEDGDKGPVGGSFAPEDAEEETYTGKVIDLDPIVREQIALALPGYPVCDESCKGLCSVCGANLNERDCGCDRHVPDPRWAGLKNIKL